MEDDEATVGRHTGPVRRERLAAVEGLRGIAIVLVVVSHVWVLWPTQGAQATAIGGLFRSGNLSVSVFLVLAGFFLVRSLLRDAEVGRIDIKESILRRWARVSAHVYTLVLAMLVVTALDAPSTYAPSDTARSALRIVTYTWNWFAMREPLLSRPDGGHLWFTSVYLQVTVALVLLVAALVRRRLVLIVTLIGLVVAVTVWRAWSAANEGEWVAFLRTTTRMDGMLWGALLATVLPWLPRLSRQAASALLAVSAAGILLLFLTASDSTYFGAAGVAVCLATSLFLWAATSGGGGPVATVLSRRPVVLLGTYSMALYIWHYPVFWWTSRHFEAWEPTPKIIVAMAIVVVLTWAAQRWVEDPVSAWLERRRATRPLRPQVVEAEPTPGLRER